MAAQRSDRLFVLAVGLVLTVVTSVPYAVGLLADLEGRFDWHLVFEADQNAYFGFMRQAREGAFFLTNPFTPEYHRPVVVNLEWAAVGYLARGTGLSLEATYHLLRGVFVLVFCGALHWLSGFLFETRLARRLVLLLLGFGGGFGWLLYLPGIGAQLNPRLFLDLGVGFHPFFWMLLQPHFLMGETLALLCLGLFLRGETTDDVRWHTGASALCAVLGLVRPYDVLHVLSALGLYTALRGLRGPERRTALWRGVLVATPSLAVLGYYLWLFRHPVIRWWAIQNSLAPLVPSVVALSLGGSALLLLSLLATPGQAGGRRPAATLLGCSAFAAFALYYAYPLLASSAQFGTMLVVPTVLVGLMGREAILVRLSRRGAWGAALLAGAVGLNALGSVALVARHTAEVARGAHRTPEAVLEAYAWLGTHARPGEVVLASDEHSNRLPRFTPVRVVSGQSFFTADYASKSRAVARFFDPRTDERWRQALVERFQVRFVVSEVGDGRGWDPAHSVLFREVFRNEALAIFVPERR